MSPRPSHTQDPFPQLFSEDFEMPLALRGQCEHASQMVLTGIMSSFPEILWHESGDRIGLGEQSARCLSFPSLFSLLGPLVRSGQLFAHWLVSG